MKNKDNELLKEAYELVSEKKTKCKYAMKGCDCNCGCKDCEHNQEDTVDEAKKLTPKNKKLAAVAKPFDKITRADIITLAKKKTIKENVEQSLGNVLASYYHKGEGLDNETLHHVLSELEDIINNVSNDHDPASALDHLISKLRVD